MKVIVSTHQGKLYDEVVDYIVVTGNPDGDFGIMENHVPVICAIEDGCIKLVRGDDEFYIVIVNGLLEFHDNIVSVLAQEAFIGRDAADAKENLMNIRKERLEKNRQESVDFTQKEKELRENLKNAKAGSL